MEKFGVKGSWTSYEYKTNRSRTKSAVTHYCQWRSEVDRFVETTDGFGKIQNDHNKFLEQIERWHMDQIKKLQVKQQEKEQREKNLIKSRELAQLQVKYNLEPITNFEDVLDVILDKNKYLHLAYWLERNRGDWNDGSHYAECGLNGFVVETDTDQQIHDNIQYHIDDWCGDGRVFRDCEWNYSVLYGMVEDEELMKDFETVQKYIN